jgi:serine protease Do
MLQVRHVRRPSSRNFHRVDPMRAGVCALLASMILLLAAATGLADETLLNADVQSPFIKVAERVAPAVAAIHTSKTFSHPGAEGQNPLEDMFRQFFPRGEAPQGQEFEMPGSGSGFVVSADGYVMTNNHVVVDANEIHVQLPGYEEPFDAEVIGVDPATDLAVLKIESKEPLPHLQFGDSDQVKVGAWAIAIGNPLGQLAGSITVGIVSAKGRSDLRIQGGTPRYQDFIQTDAAINFGNSGGPLVDIHGRVIGVNTAINASGQNIGFAIPINLAARVHEQLVRFGRVSRGYLGVQMNEINPRLAEARDLDIRHGVEVVEVVANTPAERAGLRPGDIIVGFDGAEIQTSNELAFKVADTPVGNSAMVRVYRDGKFKELEVTLAEYDEDAVVATTGGGGDVRGERWLGILAASLDDPNPRVQRILSTFDIRDESGALVVDVSAGSPADKARLRPGDVIIEIVNVEISGLQDFQQARERFAERDKPIAILIRRGDQTSYLTLDPTDG